MGYENSNNTFDYVAEYVDSFKIRIDKQVLEELEPRLAQFGYVKKESIMRQLSFSEACKVLVEKFGCYRAKPTLVLFVATCFNKTIPEVQREVDYWSKLK